MQVRSGGVMGGDDWVEGEEHVGRGRRRGVFLATRRRSNVMALGLAWGLGFEGLGLMVDGNQPTNPLPTTTKGGGGWIREELSTSG